MTEREKNGERLAMKISRHRQAKHEAIQYEDVKTAYIKGCEDTAKENSGNLDALIKENAKLEQKISVLLSCKNCPENKGGYICEKEYEGKCLAQKIQYIKELQEENENFRKTAAHQQTQNMERYFENERTKKTALLNLDGWRKSDAKLEKARALLAQWAQTSFAGACDNVNLAAETEQFLAGDL